MPIAVPTTRPRRPRQNCRRARVAGACASPRAADSSRPPRSARTRRPDRPRSTTGWRDRPEPSPVMVSCRPDARQRDDGFRIRPAHPGDESGAYYVCLKTGNHGQDGEPLYRDDPDALGRIFVGPYLAFEPDLSLMLEDEQGICGYALGALDSHASTRATTPSGARTVRAVCRAARGPAHWTPVQRRPSCVSSPRLLLPDPYEGIRRTSTSICCRGRRAADTAAA